MSPPLLHCEQAGTFFHWFGTLLYFHSATAECLSQENHISGFDKPPAARSSRRHVPHVRIFAQHTCQGFCVTTVPTQHGRQDATEITDDVSRRYCSATEPRVEHSASVVLRICYGAHASRDLSLSTWRLHYIPTLCMSEASCHSTDYATRRLGIPVTKFSLKPWFDST